MKTITTLPFEELRILKQITIVSDSPNLNDFAIGYVLFERMMSPAYKFKETPKEEKDFTYYLEYPRQDHFPSDRVDDIILQSIKNDFPKSILKNYQVITNIDEDRIKYLQKRPSEKSLITFTPSFSNLDLSLYVGKSFDCLRKKIIIYQESRKEKIQNLAFTGYYDLADKTILNDLEKINFI